MKTTVSCRNKEGEFHDVPVEELRFRPSAYGVIIREGKILLSRQWDGYDFPGGGMDLSETIPEAVVREVFEETGLSVAPREVIACESAFFSFTFSEAVDKFHANCILMYFLCDVIGGELSTANFDEDEKKYASLAEWVPLENIRDIKFYNSVDSVKIIELAMEKLSLRG